MSTRKQHAYAVALRIARVKELRAQIALAAAVEQEAAAQRQVDTIESARGAVLSANAACVGAGQSLDLPRYELLAVLDAALTQRLRQAGDVLDEAGQLRSGKAAENVSAKRQRERVDQHLHEARAAWMHAHAAKQREDGVELWLGHREEPA